MKLNDKVITPYGEGVIKKIEDFSRCKRFGVKLNCEKAKSYTDNIMFFFPEELKPVLLTEVIS